MAVYTNAKFVDNFLPYFFSTNECMKHNKLIDKIEDPEIINTIEVFWVQDYTLS